MSVKALTMFAACFLVSACGRGDDRVEVPPSPRDSLTLEKLAGTWEFEASDGKGTMTLGADGAYRLSGTSPKECATTGTASVLSGDGGYLEIKLKTDSCRELVVLRTYKIDGAGTSNVTLVEDPDKSAGGAAVKQVFRRSGAPSK